MPLYEVFALTRPYLTGAHIHQIIKRSCLAVMDRGGVVTEINSNGVQQLAYTIKKVHGHYDEAEMWQMTFHASPSVLPDLEHDLRTDENILRYMVSKHRDLAKIKQWRLFLQYVKPALPELEETLGTAEPSAAQGAPADSAPPQLDEKLSSAEPSSARGAAADSV